jgi:hypothetical protein
MKKGGDFMDQSIHPLSAWFEAQSGKSFLISKEEYLIGKDEIGDLDQIELHLDRVTLGRFQNDPDDYVSPVFIQLHGQGTIRTDEESAVLPQDVYEIPLDSSWSMSETGKALQIKTERAIYTIRPYIGTLSQ